MAESDNISLQNRIAQLEKIVSRLQTQVKQLNQTVAQAEISEPEPATLSETAVTSPETLPTPPPQPKEPSPYLQSEFWLNKIGIGLMLFALIFLFRFAVDQGWLTPPVRVAFGLLLGTGLLFFGLQTYEKRRHFSVVLLGGSMASYYITGFAAFQLYELIPSPVAFGFMILVTILTFALSLRQNEAALSLVGTLGGFSTPFLLYTGEGNTQGLILYTCLLIAGTVAIYYFRGWRILLWASSLLGWISILIAVNAALPWKTATSTGSVQAVTLMDRWVVQVGILFAWLFFWAIPLLRQYLTRHASSTLQPLSIGFADAHLPDIVKRWLGNDLHILTSSTALLLNSSTALWEFRNNQWGWVLIGFALLYGAIAFFLHTTPTLENLAITHGFTATVLLTIALIILLEDEALLIALTVEAIVWHFIKARLDNNWVRVGTHLFSLIIGLWMFGRLLESGTTDAETAVRILVDLTVIASFAGVAIYWLSVDGQRLYLLAAHIAILMLLWRELSELANGQGLISISWGVYAIILLLIGLRSQLNTVRTVGLATLFVLVGKLFLIDLENLKAIWRILLFFGFGAVFLLLSYFYQGLWKREPSSK